MCNRTRCSAWITLMLATAVGCGSSGESESSAIADTESLADVLQQQSQPGDPSTPPANRAAGAVASDRGPGNLSPVRWPGMERYPLRPDGTPDFEKYVLELYREGITQENNAAVLLWQAMWPGEYEPQHYAAVAKELGLDQVPSQEDALQPLYSMENRRRVAAWLHQNGQLRLAGQPRNDDALQKVLAMDQ